MSREPREQGSGMGSGPREDGAVTGRQGSEARQEPIERVEQTGEQDITRSLYASAIPLTHFLSTGEFSSVVRRITDLLPRSLPYPEMTEDETELRIRVREEMEEVLIEYAAESLRRVTAWLERDLEWVKRARKELGLSQVEIAERLGVKQANVSHWESGRHRPDVAMLGRWFELLMKEKIAQKKKDVELWGGRGFDAVEWEKMMEVKRREKKLRRQMNNADRMVERMERRAKELAERGE